MVTLQLNGQNTKFLIDTGAEVTVISEDTHKAIRKPSLSPPPRNVKGPSNHVLPVTGYFNGMIKLGTQETHQDVYVVKGLHQELLGRPAIEALGVVVRAGAISTLQGPVAEFPQLFEGLGKLNQPYSIKLQPSTTPFLQSVVRRVAIPLLPLVKEELERMERLGVITRVEQPTDWCTRMVVMPKPNGKICICIDLTKLNESVR